MAEILTNLKQDVFPDEIWVIQLNPATCRRVPQTMSQLVDRRNELSGNLSPWAELYHIDAINQTLDYQTRAFPSTASQGRNPIEFLSVELPGTP